MTMYTGINTFLAVLASAAAFGSLNKMRWRETRPCLMLAMLLIGIGLAGQALGLIKQEWAYYADTALYGGVFALVISSQRVHSWALERWANPIAMSVATVTAALFLFGLLGGCSRAHAQALDKPIFVVALEQLDGDLVYARSVMIAVPRPAGGHFGLILNKPSRFTMAQAFPDHGPSAAVRDPIYFGGPTAPQTVFAVTRADASPGRLSRELMPGIWLMTNAAVIDAFIEQTPNAARYYTGLVLWKPGELAEEVRRGLMVLRPVDPAKLFRPDTSTLYDELVPSGRKSPLES